MQSCGVFKQRQQAAHSDVTVYRPKSGLVVALRAERLSASRTRENGGAMMLNLRCDHLFLQASQNCLALAYRESQGGRRELLYTLNRGNFVLGGLARNHLSNQLQCPFHPNSLRHPTTLHALVGFPLTNRTVPHIGMRDCAQNPQAVTGWKR